MTTCQECATYSSDDPAILEIHYEITYKNIPLALWPASPEIKKKDLLIRRPAYPEVKTG
jgi:hypothetical protein